MVSNAPQHVVGGTERTFENSKEWKERVLNADCGVSLRMCSYAGILIMPDAASGYASGCISSRLCAVAALNPAFLEAYKMEPTAL
jgi:hypothetical protein